MNKKSREIFEGFVRSGNFTPEQLVKLKRGFEKWPSGKKVDEEKSIAHLNASILTKRLVELVDESTGEGYIGYDSKDESFEDPDATIHIEFASNIVFNAEESKLYAKILGAADIIHTNVMGMADGLPWIGVNLIFKDVLKAK